MTDKTAEQEKEAKPVGDEVENNNDAGTEKTAETDDLNVSDHHQVNTTEHVEEHSDELRENNSANANDASESAMADLPEAEQEDDAEDDSVILPGALSKALQKCRQQAGLTLEQAAEEMHLPLSMIRALESENFADLPEPPYVRGYLRSYARLSEGDPNYLINRYEVLRGADPNDITSYTPSVPRYTPSGKKSVSPTTIKLTGFSMIVLLLVVLSMIPAVSQWATDTWKAFSEPQNQRVAANSADSNSTSATDETSAKTADDAETTNTESASQSASGDTGSASSSNDTATPATNSEQLTLNEQSKPLQNVPDKAENGGNNNNDTSSPANPDNNTGTADEKTKTPPEQDSDSTDTANQNDSKTPVSQTASSSDSSVGNDSNDTNNADDKQDSTQAIAENQSTDTIADAKEANKEANAEAEQTATTPTGTTEPAATTEQQTAQADQASQVPQATDNQAEQTAQNQAQKADQFQQPIDGNVMIRLVFSQEVWMSIIDGRGKTIFSSLNSAGTVKELKASTPLQFKVGNAQGVQVYLNGQLVDQRPYTRGNVANFRAN
ncbi:MAG: DUF4115 domain-containing protein [Thiolinea sp.]